MGGGDKYSNEEHVVGNWIDGKTLYQKTCSLTMPSTEGDDKTVGTLSNLLGSNVNTTDVKNTEAICYWNSTGYTKLNDYGSSATYINHYIDASGNIKTKHKSPIYNSKPLIITFQYTKTTD